MRKGLFYTIVAAIGLVAGACERAMADDAAPSYPQSVAPVLGTSYSESAPQAAAAPCNACNSCNAGQNAGVFDSCHLGNACGGNACGGNACGCDNCCDNCCDCCCPCWCIRAGAMFLGRSTDPDHPLVTRAIAGPPPLGQPLPNTDRLDASQFAFPVTAGPDIDLIYNGCDYGFEVRYFSIGDFDTTVGPNPTVGATLQFATPIRAAANSVSASESSALSSVEINARKVVVPCVLTLLAGYRHIELTEQIFGTTVLAGTTTDVFSTQAFNKWRRNPVSQRDWDDAHLINAAMDIHADDPAFGYRFIADELEADGFSVSERRVWRLCSQEQLWSVFAKKRGLSRKAGPP